MSEISNFWFSVLISQVAPYLMFILVSQSTHPVSLVLSSQNAQCFYISSQLFTKPATSPYFEVMEQSLLTQVAPLVSLLRRRC